MSVEPGKEMLNTSNNMLKTISNVPIGTGFLAFRDIGKILNEHVNGIQALDFGCGAGRSSRILQEHGFNVIGIDASHEMIEQAKATSENIDYILIKKKCFKKIHGHYDLIFVSFVLMEISNKQEIVTLIKKLRNLLAANGKMILIVASNEFYNGDWLSIETKSYANAAKQSGDIVSVYLKDYDIRISDYLWSEEDCEQCFEKSNMVLVQKLKPLGSLSDGKNWVDEFTKAPFVTYVLSK